MNQTYLRHDGRIANEMRPLEITPSISRHSEGSCEIKYGNSVVRCTASIDNHVPYFLRGKGRGWLTAEYAMLPRATETRTDRKQNFEGGRTKEIQRLIGRSLRSACDFTAFPDWQIRIDCDVLEADGGTRTAAISGGFVAMALAMAHLRYKKLINTWPLTHYVAAISCGIIDTLAVVDLDYPEDKNAETDANFVMDEQNRLIEVQATAEGKPFTHEELLQMIQLATLNIEKIITAQSMILRECWGI